MSHKFVIPLKNWHIKCFITGMYLKRKIWLGNDCAILNAACKSLVKSWHKLDTSEQAGYLHHSIFSLDFIIPLGSRTNTITLICFAIIRSWINDILSRTVLVSLWKTKHILSPETHIFQQSNCHFVNLYFI